MTEWLGKHLSRNLNIIIVHKNGIMKVEQTSMIWAARATERPRVSLKDGVLPKGRNASTDTAKPYPRDLARNRPSGCWRGRFVKEWSRKRE